MSMAQAVPESPVLISMDGSTRAYAVDSNRWHGSLKQRPIESVSPGGSVIMFMTNVKDLLPGEGANAFRSYAEDGAKQEYLFKVETFEPVSGMPWLYAVRVRLDQNIGAVGDVLVRITWRGMTTNRVRLGVGFSGNGPKDDEGAVPTPMPWQQPVQTEAVTPANHPDVMRFMQQATFGPTPALELRLRRTSFFAWLNEQFNLPLPTNDPFLSCQSGGCSFLLGQYPNLPLQPTNIATTCTGDCRRNNYSMYPMQRWFFLNALYGEDQLRRRVSWALSQILVTSGIDVQQSSWMLQYQKALDRHAFGNYKKLLKEVTLNPTMGFYLDMMLSTRFSPNENYAREINQLFAVGLFELNMDGTPKLNGNSESIPTYTQTTIDNFTKVFTGWQTCNGGASCPNAPAAGSGIVNFIDPMLLQPNFHDTTAKTLYNYPGVDPSTRDLPAIQVGQDTTAYANGELDKAIDNIYNHPNVPPFISKNLIQHLVTSDPSPAYVQRVATVFNNYKNDDNQLRYVIYAILTDPEARGNVKNDPRYGLLREPVLFATNVLRQLGAKAFSTAITECNTATLSTCSDGFIANNSLAMGQGPYLSPTVFNFYPPDYIVPSTNPAVLGPEFAILTASTAFQRANFINQMIMTTGVANTTGLNTNAPSGTAISTVALTELQNLSTADTSGNQLMDALNIRFMHRTMSSQMRSTILTAVTAIPATSAANHLLRARTALYLVLTSSQYQIQK